MTWFYAIGQQQQGPVTEDQLQALVKDGVVTADTLVWREGMANWQPCRNVAPATVALPPAVPGAATAAAFAVGAGGGLSEQEILGREYRVDIGEALSHSWKIFTANAGIIIGACVVLFLVTAGVTMLGGLLGLLLPFANIFISLFINGVVAGGAMWFFLRMIRGEAGQFGDLFAGFGPRFWQLGLASLVQGVINIALIAPGAVTAIVLGVFSIANLKAGKFPELSVGAIGLLALIAAITFLVVVYVSLLWTFSLLLVMDKGYDFWPAMQLSRRMVSRRWWMTLLFVVVGGLVSMLGALACLVGLVVTVPLFYGMYAHLYDANFRDLAPARRE
ncbi:MAG: DUF4339 domain-containing protein [Verrucomicrobia bacterium]|nr:DUF4339 domain-containing protein [Verrucomicrobiota bacterium]